MKPDCPHSSIPPWKQELMLRKNALARTVEPNVALICQKLEQNGLDQKASAAPAFWKRSLSTGDGVRYSAVNPSISNGGKFCPLASKKVELKTELPSPIGDRNGTRRSVSPNLSSTRALLAPPPAFASNGEGVEKGSAKHRCFSSSPVTFERRRPERAFSNAGPRPTRNAGLGREAQEQEEENRKNMTPPAEAITANTQSGPMRGRLLLHDRAAAHPAATPAAPHMSQVARRTTPTTTTPSREERPKEGETKSSSSSSSSWSTKNKEKEKEEETKIKKTKKKRESVGEEGEKKVVEVETEREEEPIYVNLGVVKRKEDTIVVVVNEIEKGDPAPSVKPSSESSVEWTTFDWEEVKKPPQPQVNLIKTKPIASSFSSSRSSVLKQQQQQQQKQPPKQQVEVKREEERLLLLRQTTVANKVKTAKEKELVEAIPISIPNDNRQNVEQKTGEGGGVVTEEKVSSWKKNRAEVKEEEAKVIGKSVEEEKNCTDRFAFESVGGDFLGTGEVKTRSISSSASGSSGSSKHNPTPSAIQAATPVRAINGDIMEKNSNVTRANLARIYRNNSSGSNAATASNSSTTSSSSSANSNSALKRAIYASTSTAVVSPLDSDGTFCSGGDSDSSEEIHYGPGFVSRLKSRYMSVALRSTSSRGMTSLRRTASLENFLDKDKDDDQIELRKTTKIRNEAGKDAVDSGPKASGLYASTRTGRRPTPVAHSIHAARDRSKRKDSMKRAQSVEVLSINEAPTSSRTLPKVPSLGKKAATGQDRGLKDDLPPPLPPKEKAAIDGVVNSLANDNLIIVDAKAPPSVTAKKAVSSKPASTSSTLPHKKATSGQEITRSSDLANSRKPLYKRRSSSLLFGVEERELPAPDTVKETRKIFESRSGGPGGRKPIPFHLAGYRPREGLTKSKSTSNLYHSERDESPTSEAARTTRKQQSEDHMSASSSKQYQGSSSRRTSVPNVATPPPQSPVKKCSATAKPVLPSKPAHLSSPSPSSTLSANHAANNRTNNSKSIPSDGAATANIPSSPSSYGQELLHHQQIAPPKPFKTTDTTTTTFSSSSSSNASSMSVTKDLPKKLSSSSSSSPPSSQQSSVGGSFAIPQLRPVKKSGGGGQNVAASSGGGGGVGAGKKNSEEMKNSLESEEEEEEEEDDDEEEEDEDEFGEQEGIKRVSSDSINKIRQGGSSMSFNFNSNNASKSLSGGNRSNPSYLPNAAATTSGEKQVGIIRPITRDPIPPALIQKENQKNKINNAAIEQPTEKEVLVIEKELLPPQHSPPNAQVKSWKAISEKNRNVVHSQQQQQQLQEVSATPSWVKKVEEKNNSNNSASSNNNQSIVLARPAVILGEEEEEIEGQRKPTVVEKQQTPTTTPLPVKSISTTAPSTTNKKLTSFAENNVSINNIHNNNHSGNSAALNMNGSSDKAATKPKLDNGHSDTNEINRTHLNNKLMAANGYRDSWKKRNDEQNTMVFNFVNSQKDVTHIENDGRDISRRNKKGKKVKVGHQFLLSFIC